MSGIYPDSPHLGAAVENVRWRAFPHSTKVGFPARRAERILRP
jgi:hypothetical protein